MFVRIARVVGVVLFAIAFFLPAVRSVETSGPGSGPEPGYVCAMVAIAITGRIFKAIGAPGKDALGVFTIILSGWLNPLILAYLAFLPWPRFLITRRILAAGTVICLVATWIFFADSQMVPLIGHFFWAAGALLIVAGEIVPKPKAEESPTNESNSNCRPPGSMS